MQDTVIFPKNVAENSIQAKMIFQKQLVYFIQLAAPQKVDTGW